MGSSPSHWFLLHCPPGHVGAWCSSEMDLPRDFVEFPSHVARATADLTWC